MRLDFTVANRVLKTQFPENTQHQQRSPENTNAGRNHSNAAHKPMQKPRKHQRMKKP